MTGLLSSSSLPNESWSPMSYVMSLNSTGVLLSSNPWKHSLPPFGPDHISLRWPSLVKSMEGTSENITPVWAISPHTPAAATLYSSGRTWRQWLTWMILKYAQSIISHATYAHSARQCVTISVSYSIQGPAENDISSALLLDFDLFANTVVFGYGHFLCTKWKGCRSYWFCSSIHLQLKCISSIYYSTQAPIVTVLYE